MSKKIGIAGYASLKNYGDTFIVRCNEYLVKTIGDYEIIEIDFEGGDEKRSFLRRGVYYGILLASKLLKGCSIGAILELLAVNVDCRSYYKRKLAGVDALLFANGSLKYGTQKQWAYESLIVNIAEKHGIPVMFTACNIQRYDDSNWKCRYLTKTVNKSCVKAITTRDGQYGVKRLRDEYHIRTDIVCAGVGDVAYWIPETYGCRHNREADIVGINLIQGNQFRRYGGMLSEEKLLKAYCELLLLLDESGIRWELFTNGLKDDKKFGYKLLSLYGNKNLEIKEPQNDSDLLKIICDYKGIVGGRLHACIAAYALDIPFIGMIWDEKLLYFSKMAGMEEYMLNEAEINGRRLYDALIKVLNIQKLSYDTIRQQYKKLNKHYIQKFLEDNL